VVAGIGLCALDRTRTPIRADEVRACWQAPEVVEAPRGLFAMVEALEATSRAESSEEQDLEEGASGLDRLRRLVFSARVADRHETDESDSAPDFVAEASSEDESAASRRDNRSTPPEFKVGPPPPAGGQLHDADTVSPALRLSYRGDARALREAAVEAVSHREPRVGAR
jgi:hypothetical protein